MVPAMQRVALSLATALLLAPSCPAAAQAPEITKLGVEMFAVCAKDAAKADNSPGRRQAKEALFNKKFEQQSKRYLQDLRRQALIEYK